MHIADITEIASRSQKMKLSFVFTSLCLLALSGCSTLSGNENNLKPWKSPQVVNHHVVR
jgi:hypothetical protein